MSDLKQEALEAAIRAYGPSYSDHTHQLDLSAACEAYYEARRAGEAAAFQVPSREEIMRGLYAPGSRNTDLEHTRQVDYVLSLIAQRPAQSAGVETLPDELLRLLLAVHDHMPPDWTTTSLVADVRGALDKLYPPAQPAGVEWSRALDIVAKRKADIEADEHLGSKAKDLMASAVQTVWSKLKLAEQAGLAIGLGGAQCPVVHPATETKPYALMQERAEKAERELAECRRVLALSEKNESDLMTARENLLAEQTRLERELAECRESHAQATKMINEHDAEFAECEAECTGLTEELAECREQLKAALSGDYVAKLHAELAGYETLKQHYNQVDGERSEAWGMYHNSQAHLLESGRELAECRETLADREAVLNRAVREREECREERAEFKRLWEGRDAAFDQECADHQATTEDLCERAESAETKLAEANAALKYAQDAVQDYCDRWNEANAARKAAEAREKRLREACAWTDRYATATSLHYRDTLPKAVFEYLRRIQAALADTAQLAEPESANQPAKSEPVSVPDELPKPGDVLTGEQAKAYLLGVPGSRVGRDGDSVYEARGGEIGFSWDGAGWRPSTSFYNADIHDGTVTYIVLPPATPESKPSETPNSSVTLEGLAAKVGLIERLCRFHAKHLGRPHSEPLGTERDEIMQALDAGKDGG